MLFEAASQTLLTLAEDPRRLGALPSVTLPDACGPKVLDDLRRALLATSWVVYAKAPFGGAAQVYAYLGRYTHRVGVSSARLRTMDARGVTFATKKGREITLPGEKFLRRFVEHVLPRGFTRIRHYGLLAASHATTTLERARALLTPAPPVAPTKVAEASATATPSALSWQERLQQITGENATRCARCGVGHIVRGALAERAPAAGCDTS